MRKISTTITQKYFDMKIQDLQKDGYFYEYKEQKEHWNKRLRKLIIGDGQMGEDTEIVFLVGNKPHRFKVELIQYTPVIPKRYAEAIKTEYAYAIKCVLAGERYYPNCHCEKECDFDYVGSSDRGGYPVKCITHGVTLPLGTDPGDTKNCCQIYVMKCKKESQDWEDAMAAIKEKYLPKKPHTNAME